MARPRARSSRSRRSSAWSALFVSMGVADVRLTGGEPLVRRDFPRWSRCCAAIEDAARPLADDQRLPARGHGGRARRRRPAAHQRVARLPLARPLLPDDPARLRFPRCSRGLEALERHPADQPDQGQLRGDARLHRGRGASVRRAGAAQALPGAVHRVHAAGRRPRLVGGPGPDRRRDPRHDRRGPPARAAAARRALDRARLPLRATAAARSASSTRSRSRSAATATGCA